MTHISGTDHHLVMTKQLSTRPCLRGRNPDDSIVKERRAKSRHTYRIEFLLATVSVTSHFPSM